MAPKRLPAPAFRPRFLHCAMVWLTATMENPMEPSQWWRPRRWPPRFESGATSVAIEDDAIFRIPQRTYTLPAAAVLYCRPFVEGPFCG